MRPALPDRPTGQPVPPSHDLEGVDESTWLDVIHKMDEVYSQLVADEIALEQKNSELEQSQQFIFSLLTAMSDVLAACNEAGQIEETNAARAGGPPRRRSARHAAGRDDGRR
jgi:two-component system sensor histidine kinase HupT/HoxJ